VGLAYISHCSSSHTTTMNTSTIFYILVYGWVGWALFVTRIDVTRTQIVHDYTYLASTVKGIN